MKDSTQKPRLNRLGRGSVRMNRCRLIDCEWLRRTSNCVVDFRLALHDYSSADGFHII